MKVIIIERHLLLLLLLLILGSGEKNGKGEIDKYAGFGKIIRKE